MRVPLPQAGAGAQTAGRPILKAVAGGPIASASKSICWDEANLECVLPFPHFAK